MPKKLTTKEFIGKANVKHNNKYDYSEVEYINSHSKIKIICTKHNTIFYQVPYTHLNGNIGCKSCSSEKTKQTNLEKYGVEYPLQSVDIHQKATDTNLLRYGVENPFQFHEFKEKSKQTCIEKFGVENVMLSEKIKEKIKQTNLKRYGTENPTQNEEIKEKIKQTNLERYGVEYPFQSLVIREKGRQTMLDRYGVEFTFHVPKFKEKIKQTMLDRYGVEFIHQSAKVQEKMQQNMFRQFNVKHSSQRHILPLSLKLLNDKTWLIRQHHLEQKPLKQIAHELEIGLSTICRYFKRYNIEIKYFQRSLGECNLDEFIQSMGYKTTTNTRNILRGRLEIDIFIPEINIALEYNGLYWHKDKGINYHKNKTEMCNSQNISLMHIWEDQWNDNQEKTKENVIKFLTDVPQCQLLEEIEIDLATDNPQIYTELGYKIISKTNPQLYSEDIWDCGKMYLIKQK